MSTNQDKTTVDRDFPNILLGYDFEKPTVEENESANTVYQVIKD